MAGDEDLGKEGYHTSTPRWYYCNALIQGGGQRGSEECTKGKERVLETLDGKCLVR
jgi:hypothetical protein